MAASTAPGQAGGIPIGLRHRRRGDAILHVRPARRKLTWLNGSTGTLAGLRGQKTVLWLAVAGCSSCGVSVPAVAEHLNILAADGWQVVALDLSGDLPAGNQGLRAFLQATGGDPDDSRRPRWTWGLASQPLSMAYDATGTPDPYYLPDEHGRLRYQGSVPVSIMPQLLSHTEQLATGSS